VRKFLRAAVELVVGLAATAALFWLLPSLLWALGAACALIVAYGFYTVAQGARAGRGPDDESSG
jgi:hypothetical protein